MMRVNISSWKTRSTDFLSIVYTVRMKEESYREDFSSIVYTFSNVTIITANRGCYRILAQVEELEGSRRDGNWVIEL